MVIVQEDIYTRQGGGGKVQSEAARLLVDPSSAPLELAASAAAAESMSSEPRGSSGLASSSWPPSRHICTASCGAGARASSSPDSSAEKQMHDHALMMTRCLYTSITNQALLQVSLEHFGLTNLSLHSCSLACCSARSTSTRSCKGYPQLPLACVPLPAEVACMSAFWCECKTSLQHVSSSCRC